MNEAKVGGQLNSCDTTESLWRSAVAAHAGIPTKLKIPVVAFCAYQWNCGPALQTQLPNLILVTQANLDEDTGMFTQLQQATHVWEAALSLSSTYGEQR